MTSSVNGASIRSTANQPYDAKLYTGWYLWHYRSPLVCSKASTQAASNGDSGGSSGCW
jgi:hypothetical protein